MYWSLNILPKARIRTHDSFLLIVEDFRRVSFKITNHDAMIA